AVRAAAGERCAVLPRAPPLRWVRCSLLDSALAPRLARPSQRGPRPGCDAHSLSPRSVHCSAPRSLRACTPTKTLGKLRISAGTRQLGPAVTAGEQVNPLGVLCDARSLSPRGAHPGEGIGHRVS